MNLLVFKRLRYYFKVWITTIKLSLSRASTYRIEFISRFLRGIMLVAIQLVYVHAVTGNSGSFAGWSVDEMYLLLGIFNTINYLSWSIFSINLWRLEEKILKGEFDFLLLRPNSSLFSTAFHDFFIDDAISGVSGLILIGFYFFRNFANLEIGGILLGLIASLCAFIIWFSLETIVASFDFINIKNGLREIKKAITNIARFPFEIWDGGVRTVFYTIFPIAFVSAVPAGLVFGLFDLEYVIYSIIISLIFLTIARIVWNICVKKYTSAGG